MLIDFDKLSRTAADRHQDFVSADPFSHVVIDDFLPAETAEAVLREFPAPGQNWNHLHHYNEKKLALDKISRMGEVTRALFAELQSDRFLATMERLTGIERLISDPDLDGAGLHQIVPGGFLNVHTDFLSHTTRQTWSRQINLLLYFNKNWRSDYNGDLELWDASMGRCVQKIAPAFNRCVIFHTAEKSFHGHPGKLSCPPGETRKSIALYYFREEGTLRQLSPTNYQPLPTDAIGRRLMIAADRQLLRLYSALKRRGWINDAVITKLLKWF